MGVDTEFVSLAGRWVKLEGGGLQSCTTPPPLFALQNLSRCPRDNNKIINVGEKTWLCLQAMTVSKPVSGFVNRLYRPKS